MLIRRGQFEETCIFVVSVLGTRSKIPYGKERLGKVNWKAKLSTQLNQQAVKSPGAGILS